MRGILTVISMLDPFFVAGTILLILPIQLLLCFYAKKIVVRLLPVCVLTISVLYCYVKMYELFAVMLEALIFLCGFAWGIWVIAKFVQKIRGMLIR